MPLFLFHKKYSQNLSEILQLSEINIKTGKFVQFCVADSMQPLFVFFTRKVIPEIFAKPLLQDIFLASNNENWRQLKLS